MCIYILRFVFFENLQAQGVEGVKCLCRWRFLCKQQSISKAKGMVTLTYGLGVLY